MIDWVTAYHDVLLQTGWIQRGEAEAWTEERVLGANVHEKILSVVAVVLGAAPAALAIVTAALESLHAMNDDSPWITLFDRRGRSATAVGFQVANCEASEGGAALHAVDFRVHAAQELTQVLFFKFTSQKASMLRRGVVLELTPAALKDFGPRIQERVSRAVLNSIAAIPLADPRAEDQYWKSENVGDEPEAEGDEAEDDSQLRVDIADDEIADDEVAEDRDSLRGAAARPHCPRWRRYRERTPAEPPPAIWPAPEDTDIGDESSRESGGEQREWLVDVEDYDQETGLTVGEERVVSLSVGTDASVATAAASSVSTTSWTGHLRSRCSS